MTTAALSNQTTDTIRAPESWDDDDDLLFDDNESISDLKESHSSSLQAPTRRRTSCIRPLTGLKTLEENDKEDITQQFELSTDDIEGAFNLALEAGIPIPKDTPSSALIGGTINRLGSLHRKGQPVNMDDWSEDIDFPDAPALQLSVRQNTQRTPSPLPLEFAPRQSASLNSTKEESGKDDFEGDFDIPPDVGTFELKSPSMRKEVTTPLPSDDFDDWVEGSLGTRYAGTRRVGVLSDFSPSASSAITVESDADDPMEGLEFSSTHVNLQEVLDRRMKERGQEMSPTKPRLQRQNSVEEDLFDGLELDDEETPFQASKLKANRNILHRLQEASPASPQRKVAVSVTFADKPSKIPRPSVTPLPIPPLPSPSTSQRPSTPYTHRPASARLSDGFNDKLLQKKPSVANFSQFHSTQADSFRNRVLGAKTSMPALRAVAQSQSQSPTKPRMPPPQVPERAKSRTGRSSGGTSRTESPRPRSPEVGRNDIQSTRPAFIPGGASVATSHHVAALKAPLRQGSMSTIRSASSSGKRTPMFAPENLRREAMRTRVLTTPRRIRDFGDGSELDAFDDLPVSHATEKKYRVQAKGVGTPNGVHRFTTPNNTVRKPNDENRREPVSRIDWRNPVPARTQQTTSQKPPRKLAPSSKQNTIKGRPKPPGKGPTLIKNLNSSHEPKVHGKMTYNPRTHRWDGNEDILRDFETVSPRDVFTPPRPALISNITSGSIRGVQVVGGMIFDPQRMCWLSNASADNPDGLDEDDPFEGLEDLKDDEGSHMASEGGLMETDDTVLLGKIGNDFEIDVAWKEKQVEWETRWKATMKGWNHGASVDRGEERKRTELFDIWHLANSSKR